MTNFYAQINKFNICTNILTNINIENINKYTNIKLIPIESYNIDLLGQIYNFDTHTWEEQDELSSSECYFPPVNENAIIQPTQNDRIELLCNEILEKLKVIIQKGDI